MFIISIHSSCFFLTYVIHIKDYKIILKYTYIIMFRNSGNYKKLRTNCRNAFMNTNSGVITTCQNKTTGDYCKKCIKGGKTNYKFVIITQDGKKVVVKNSI